MAMPVTVHQLWLKLDWTKHVCEEEHSHHKRSETPNKTADQFTDPNEEWW